MREGRKEEKNSETKLLFSVSYKTVLDVRDVKINIEEEEFYRGSFKLTSVVSDIVNLTFFFKNKV